MTRPTVGVRTIKDFVRVGLVDIQGDTAAMNISVISVDGISAETDDSIRNRRSKPRFRQGYGMAGRSCIEIIFEPIQVSPDWVSIKAGAPEAVVGLSGV